MTNKLFIPGPTEVRKEVLDELTHPQIGHRTKEFTELFGSLKPGLKKIFCTENDVLISTSSGSGFWEASIRSCVNEKVLHAVNGAFSKKWASVSERCGKKVERIIFDYGKAVKPEVIDDALSKGNFEVFCMVHNETPTGVMSDLDVISKVMEKHPNVLWFVDAVSSIGGIKIETDKLGIDICLASVQKAIALPAGIAAASISSRSYEKAKNVEGRGYYFDVLELKKYYDKDMTPYTPSIPHLYALKKQIERIEKEGLDNRFKRHKEMASFAREWAKKNGFEMFSEEGYHSDTVSCIINNKKDVDFKEIKRDMAKKGYSIDSGYREMNSKLEEEGKNPTFRIAHMGDLTLDEIKEYTAELEKYWS
ncbi:aminotransferase [Candidatus Woesearchaeota archaeon]|nr:aminotransferase [Candidatus Woesearchaeota archaeon]|tara:strand:+ start:5508 stop:6599 length:1092 start_codon:yes stop_codon:yes gene_type:complete